MVAEPTPASPLPDLPSLCLAITEHAPLPIATVEGATHIVRYANPAFCRLLDEPAERLIGKPLSELLPEKDECITLLDRVFRGRRAESHIEKDDSKPHPVFWSYTMWPVLQDEDLVGVMLEVTETTEVHGKTVAMNEALVLGSIRQHELTAAAEELNVQLLEEVSSRGRIAAELSQKARELAEKARLLDLSHDAIIVRDMEGHIRYWNHGAEELYGWSREEALGKVSHLLLQTEFPIPLEQMTAELHRTDRWIGELVHTARDGRRLTVLARKTLDRDREGHPAAVLENITDITARKQTEEALRGSEARFRAAVGLVSSLIWTNNKHGMMEGEQPGWGNFTGQTREDYRGQGWARAVHPEDAQPTIDAWNQAVAEKRMFEFQHRVRRADGAWRLCSVRAAPVFAESGAIVEWVGVHTDITDQKRSEEILRQSEERYRALITASSDVVYRMSADWSELGPIDGRGLVGSSAATNRTWFEDNIFPEDRPQIRAAIQEAIRTKGVFALEHRVRRADGTAGWTVSRAVPVCDARGEIVEWFGTASDITERRRLEDALVARAEDLARADRSKDEFLAMLAHELRNPLAPLRSAAEILQTDGASAEACALAQGILTRQIENMSQMIDDLLDVSRITEGKIALRPQVVALADVMHAAASLARPGMEARGQELKITLPAEPVFLHADATRLDQVFGNLLTNACKYSGSGCHIAVTAEVVPHESHPSHEAMGRMGPMGPIPLDQPREVIVRVRDDGIGIAPELLPRIFDLFVQATRSLDRAHGGLGIGLTLVQRLVKLHGGSVEARSAGLDQGSEFIVRLPILTTTAAPAPPPAAPAHDLPRRILVVDDNEDSARSMATLQGLRGHATRTAFTGPDAVVAAAEFAPHVVLLDIGLPGMDGYEVARRLRAMPAMAGSFLVALSGYGSSADRARARAAGFDEYLVKPADLDVLREWLRRRP